MEISPNSREWFISFAANAEPLLRIAPTASLGQDKGQEASAEGNLLCSNRDVGQKTRLQDLGLDSGDTPPESIYKEICRL